MTHALVVTMAAAAALLLSGCGGSGTQSQSATSTATPSATPSSEPAATDTESSSAAAAPTSQAAAAGPAMCQSAGLTASTAASEGAAGSVYMQLILTNSGTEPCLLKGYAGVSLTTGADGEPIGAAATRDDTTPVTDVVLTPGKAGAATLRYTQASNYGDCARTAAAGFRVYPPNDTASLFIAQALDACSNTEINLLTIGAFQPK